MRFFWQIVYFEIKWRNSGLNIRIIIFKNKLCTLFLYNKLLKIKSNSLNYELIIKKLMELILLNYKELKKISILF